MLTLCHLSGITSVLKFFFDKKYQDFKIEQEEANDSNRERQLFRGTVGSNCGQFFPIPALPKSTLFSDFLFVRVNDANTDDCSDPYSESEQASQSY